MYVLGKLDDIEALPNKEDYDIFKIDEFSNKELEDWLWDNIANDYLARVLIVSADISGVFKDELDYLLEYGEPDLFENFEYLTPEIKTAIEDYKWTIVPKPLASCETVGQLIEALGKFDKDLPILGAYSGWIRENEYFPVDPTLSNLDKQNTSGDPEFYGSQECVVLKGY